MGCKFVTRESVETRSWKQRLHDKCATQRGDGEHHIDWELNKLRKQLAYTVCSQPFMLFIQYEVKKQSQLGSWDENNMKVIEVGAICKTR